MAVTRLSNSQKEELADRFRQGETAQALALAFSCSANTVSRVLKSLVDPEELVALKQRRHRGPLDSSSQEGGVEVQQELEAATDLVPVIPEQPDPGSALEADLERAVEGAAEGGLDGEDPHGSLAIDDADDFGDDPVDEAVDDAADGAGDDPLDDGDGDADPPGAGGPKPTLANTVAVVESLSSVVLPASLYLLVDKTVELQAQPLKEFPDLGLLPEGEAERQALMLYSNPRQAKRHCGRTQRVIKVPDSGVFQRTASYLRAQGITRLVLEGGGVYSLPGS